MAKPTYRELLLDPRWQRVRLKKLEAADWACQLCYDNETTLSVHHKRYVKGRQPWEYEDHELVVLCQPCHQLEHEAKDLQSELLCHLHVDGPASASEFFVLGAGYVSEQTNDSAMHEAARRLEAEAPYVFECGRFIAALGFSRVTHAGFRFMADQLLLNSESKFSDELWALLGKYGLLRRGDE